MSKYDELNWQWARNFSNEQSTDMLVNGSVTPVNFDIRGPAGDKNLILVRCLVVIEDASQSYTTFGGLTALNTGMRVVVTDPGGIEKYDMLQGHEIKRNGDWVHLAGVDANLHGAGAALTFFSVRWTLGKGSQDGLELPTGWNLRFIIRDDVSAMDEFRIYGQGYLE